MCIYCGTDNYRKIYEHHYGTIPKDEDGRTYQIHHIDGNHDNNNPLNLKAVTIQEHYDIHNSQGDFGACLLISGAMDISPEEKSNLAKLDNEQKIKNKTHNFMRREDGTSLQTDRVVAKKHHLLKREDGTSHTSDRIANGSFYTPFSKTGKNHSKYNSTLYTFVNNVTGDIITATCYEFRKTYNLHHAPISMMTNGVRKTHKGWSIL